MLYFLFICLIFFTRSFILLQISLFSQFRNTKYYIFPRDEDPLDIVYRRCIIRLMLQFYIFQTNKHFQ